MLFNSYIFIFIFLPLSLVGFYLLAKISGAALAKTWLFLSSLFYYGWWNPSYLLLISGSILANFVLGKSISDHHIAPASRKILLVVGISANLGLLAWFKYANFGMDTIGNLFGFQWTLVPIVLPLAISFFTFQQIAFLVDSFKETAREYRFVDYALFVSFFPQLIAGPIVHHSEMMPQFSQGRVYRFKWLNLAVGLAIFTIGLSKKILIADPFGEQAGKVFDAVALGIPVSVSDAWLGAFAFAFQLYFDFSGYTDMAIGAARMFGIRLPTNFSSPYKATGAIDFWRRWHITLSRFLRDYIYIPLGGNRQGMPSQLSNVMVTMLVGGLWHGAGWQFIVWGGVHGCFLVVNHLWKRWRLKKPRSTIGTARWLSRVFTFFLVVLAWILFRSETLSAAGIYYSAMLGVESAALGPILVLPKVWFWVAGALVLVWFFPNTQQIMRKYCPVVEEVSPPDQMPWLVWRPSFLTALVGAIFFTICILSITRPSEFLYYQF